MWVCVQLWLYTKEATAYGDTKARATLCIFSAAKQSGCYYRTKDWETRGRGGMPQEQHCCSLPSHFPRLSFLKLFLMLSIPSVFPYSSHDSGDTCTLPSVAYLNYVYQNQPWGSSTLSPWWSPVPASTAWVVHPFGFWGLSLSHGPQAGTVGPAAQGQHGDKAAAVSYKSLQSLRRYFPAVARYTATLYSQGKAGLSLGLDPIYWGHLLEPFLSNCSLSHNCWPLEKGYVCVNTHIFKYKINNTINGFHFDTRLYFIPTSPQSFFFLFWG